MKWLGYIFSIYILLLSVLPCGDEQDCAEGQPIAISAGTESPQHEHFSEFCSPFCVCACCTTSIPFPQQQATLTVLLEQRETLATGRDDNYQYHNSAKIWQPPRVS